MIEVYRFCCFFFFLEGGGGGGGGGDVPESRDYCSTKSALTGVKGQLHASLCLVCALLDKYTKRVR